MKKEELQKTFPEIEQIMRETKTTFILDPDVQMEITTFVRIYPSVILNDNFYITFHLKKDNISVKSGTVHKMLMDKYFKPSMIQW